MEKTEDKIKDCLKDCFVCGFGVFSEFPFIDLAKKNSREIYRLWIDSDWNIDSVVFNYDDLSEDQIEVLKLNELRNLGTIAIALNEKNDLIIDFDEGKSLLVSGNPVDKNILEPIRLYQIEPENITIWISERN